MARNARSAFTLVEVLVVIAITSLLAGLILTYSSRSRDQVALYVEQAKLAQTIAKAKSLTVSTYNQPELPCGYGVHIGRGEKEANTYTLFSYDAPTCSGISMLDPAFMTEISTEHLRGGLTFSEPDPKSVNDIIFLPPDPQTWIWLHDGIATSTEGEVRIISASGPIAVTVSVSSAGQISF